MYYDPSGHFALTTLIILGLVAIGALAGFGTAMYVDYQDDGQIFNGSVKWYDYLGATVLGGAIGGLIGYFAAPTIAGLLTSTETITLGMAFAGGLGSTGGAIAISTLGEIALAGTAVLTGAGAFGAILMFAKVSRKSGKETSSNNPSWVNESMVDFNKTAQQNAKDILDWKYGSGNWSKGPRSEYNIIVKWIERYLKYYRGY